MAYYSSSQLVTNSQKLLAKSIEGQQLGLVKGSSAEIVPHHVKLVIESCDKFCDADVGTPDYNTSREIAETVINKAGLLVLKEPYSLKNPDRPIPNDIWVKIKDRQQFLQKAAAQAEEEAAMAVKAKIGFNKYRKKMLYSKSELSDAIDRRDEKTVGIYTNPSKANPKIRSKIITVDHVKNAIFNCEFDDSRSMSVDISKIPSGRILVALINAAEKDVLENVRGSGDWPPKVPYKIYTAVLDKLEKSIKAIQQPEAEIPEDPSQKGRKGYSERATLARVFGIDIDSSWQRR